MHTWHCGTPIVLKARPPGVCTQHSSAVTTPKSGVEQSRELLHWTIPVCSNNSVISVQYSSNYPQNDCALKLDIVCLVNEYAQMYKSSYIDADSSMELLHMHTGNVVFLWVQPLRQLTSITRITILCSWKSVKHSFGRFTTAVYQSGVSQVITCTSINATTHNTSEICNEINSMAQLLLLMLTYCPSGR